MNPTSEATILASKQGIAEISDRAQAGQGDAQEELVSGSHSGVPVYCRRPDHDPCAKSTSVTAELNSALRGLLSQAPHAGTLLHFAALLAATSSCLYRYTRSSRIAIGSPAIERDNESSPPGNLSIIVTDVNGSMNFGELFNHVRKTLVEGRPRTYPLELILAEAEKRGIHNRCPFFDVALVIAGLHPPMPDARHDITVTLNYQPSRAYLHAVFSPEVYEPETIRRFCQHILRALQSGLEDTNGSVSHLALPTEQEKRTLADWNNTEVEYRRNLCVHEIFEEQAMRFPDRIALVCGTQRLTYRELDERANQLARYLRQMEIAPNTPIGLFLNRSVDQVIGLLGVLKAGAAYIPYDPAYPKERLAAMFEDLQPKGVLTTENLLDRLPDVNIRRICIDKEAKKIACESTEKPDVRPERSHLCYIIFTSGSTGRAKAASVCHGGWMNLLNWFVQQFNVSPKDRTLVMSSISFDITQRAMAMPLTSGGELHLLASDHFDPELILHTIDRCSITLMNCAPSTFYPLVEGREMGSGYGRLRSLRWLILGGEAISASRLKGWATAEGCKTEVANVYGAAECSDVSSFYVLHDYDRYIQSSVPIGKAIYNTQIYLLDEHLQLVPLGVAGEICLAGDGVGKGYINDAEQTTRKFPHNPFATDPSKRMYRTGDLARYLPDGNLEFIGRVDNQVKIRGQRVELGEIETVLRQQASVREAVVIQSQSDDFERLVAYVVSTQPATEYAEKQLIDELRTTLAAKLPRHMMPNLFVVLPEMPLNPNGKIDRGALPVPVTAGARTILDPPQTETEKILAALFARLLKTEGIGVGDNFFSLGGNSLQVTKLLADIVEAFEMEFEAIDFYEDPTIESIASIIDAARNNGNRREAGAS